MHKRIHKVVSLVTAALLFVTSTFAYVNTAYAAETVKTDDAYETTYAIAELGTPGGYDYTSEETDGGLLFNYSKQYAEVQYAIPEDVVKAGLKGYKVSVSKTEYLGLKIYQNDGNKAEAYWVDHVEFEDDSAVPTIIGFMNCADGENAFEFSSVTFITARELGVEAPADPENPGEPDTPVVEPEVPEEPEVTVSDYTFSAADLAFFYRWSGAAADNGKLEFGEQYYEYLSKLPTAISFDAIESVTLNVSEQTGAFAIKFYNDETITKDSKEVDVIYGQNGKTSYVYTPSAEGSLTHIGIMSHLEDGYPFSVKVDSLVIKVKGGAVVEPEEPEKPSDLVFDKNLSFAGRWDGAPTDSNNLTFGAQYSEYLFDLGTTLSTSQVDSVIVAVSEQENDFSLKFYDDTMNEMQAQYHNKGDSVYEFVPEYSGAIRYVGFMGIPEETEAYPYSVKIDSITVKVNGSVPVEPEKPVTENGVDVFEKPSFANRWGGAAPESNTLEFASQYQEFVFDLGKTYDANDVQDVLTEVADQGNEICIKLYDSGMNELQQDYHCKGKDVYSLTPNYDGELRYIGIMSMPEVADGVYPYSVTITKFTVKYTPKVYEETQLYNAENLVFTFKSTGKTVEGNDLEFTQEWDEYRFELTKPVRGDKIKSLKVTVKGSKGLDLCFKLYSGDTEVLPFYHYSDNATHTLNCTVDDDITGIAIMAMNNQDDKFPARVVFESAELVVDTTPDTEPPVEKGVEYDIVNLCDEMTAVLGDDFIVGCAISSAEFNDAMEMELVTKHFNGVTLGNELKPDSMLRANAEKVMVTVGNQEILFPVLNFSTPDRYLDYFVNWNNEHPDKKIRIRGHVLVWHSQTPDFFFHEDYDESKPFVTPDVMNLRLEAYIRAVCEHYTSEGSKYKELFYGWDVVNEAISDGSGTYRDSGSAWWTVYHSPEFINNAFVYANRYMPADIALFYNDYNAYQPGKAKGILTLIENVKATPGSRIDGMGMQAHYFTADNNPTMESVKKAAQAYGELVDQVQFTEIDFKGSTGPKDEQLAKRYKDLYDTVRRLIDEGTNVTGFTIWGVVDKHSWLQNQNSAGGGSTTNSKQYPLLFDNNYKAKPAFYALCNAGELEPEIRNISMVQIIDGMYCGEEYFLNDEVAAFYPGWDADSVSVYVRVKDENVDENDSFTVYLSDGESIHSLTVNRSDAKETEEGYSGVVFFGDVQEAVINNKIKLDVVVTDGEQKYAFGDTTFSQDTTDKYYAVATTKPLLGVQKGSVDIDGVADEAAWANVESVPLTINLGADVTATAKLLWDEEYLYVLMDVKDSVLNKDASQAHEQDSVEVFIDENNAKASAYQEDDKQYRINYLNERSFNGTKCTVENMLSAVVLTEEGYLVEAAFKWTDIEAKAGEQVGLELQVNDANEKGTRSGTLSWADKTGNGWSAPEVFGTIVLVDKASEEPATPTPVTPAPSTPASGSSSSSDSGSSSSTPAQSTPAADTQANAQAAAPVNETPGRVTPSQRNTENATAETQEPTAEVSEEKEETPAAPEPAAEEVTEEVKEIEESETALAAAPEAEVAAVAAADNKTLPVAATVVLALAVIGAGGAVWFLKLRHLVK